MLVLQEAGLAGHLWRKGPPEVTKSEKRREKKWGKMIRNLIRRQLTRIPYSSK